MEPLSGEFGRLVEKKADDGARLFKSSLNEDFGKKDSEQEL